MHDVALVVASYVVNAIWQVPLLAGVGWLGSTLLRRVGALTEHWMWVAILAGAVVLPACNGIGVLGWFDSAAAGSGFASARLIAADSDPSSSALLMLPGAAWVAVCWFYLAVSIFFTVRFVGSLWFAERIVRRAVPTRLNAEQAQVWKEISIRFELSRGKILTSKEAPGPLTLFVHGPVLILPEQFTETTSIRNLRAALAHEGAHLQRNDFLKNLVYEAVSLLIAFHPMTWLIKAKISQTREVVCDCLAAEASGGSRIYVQALLQLASAITKGPQAINTHAIGIFDANILEKRVMMLRTKNTPISAAKKLWLVSAASACFVLTAAGGAAAPVRIGADADTKVYTVGGDVSAPKLVEAPEPEFPKERTKSKEPFNGTCTIGLTVDEQGKPREVHVVRSLAADFDQEAVNTVEKYRFAPAMRHGKAVPVAMKIEVNFQRF